MNWNANDIDVYLQEKDYIDTAVVPLLPIRFGSGMKQAAEQGEFITLLSVHLERQFKGRMLFFPPYAYIDEPENMGASLKEWELKMKESGFSYLFFLTSDHRWKQLAEKSESTFIYIPAVPLQHMDETYKHSIMEDQTKQLMRDIIKGWQPAE